MLFVWFLILLLARQRKNSSLCSKGDVLLASGAPRCVSRIDSVSSWLIPSSIIRFSNRMKGLFNLLYLKFSLNMSLSIYIYVIYLNICISGSDGEGTVSLPLSSPWWGDVPMFGFPSWKRDLSQGCHGMVGMLVPGGRGQVLPLGSVLNTDFLGNPGLHTEGISRVSVM